MSLYDPDYKCKDTESTIKEIPMILQVGGTGFIGKHICVKLSELGVANISISRNTDMSFLGTYAPKTKGYRLDEDQGISFLAGQKIDTVIYLASASIPGKEKNNLEYELDYNLKPAMKTLRSLVELNPNLRIIYLSSGGTVYGPGEAKKNLETDELNPLTPYSFGKVSIENYIKYLCNNTNATYTILRVSNPVGKWHKNKLQGFIGASIARVIDNKPITVFGDGEVIRDYVDADELAAAVTMVCQNKDLSENKIWNVGSGHGSSLNDVIASLERVVGKQLDVEYIKSRSSDLEYNVLDCQKIKDELGWSAQLNMDQLLRKTWDEIVNDRELLAQSS